jgi:hypothetical protein
LLSTGKNNIFRQHKHPSDGNQKYKHGSALRLEALSGETGAIYQLHSNVFYTNDDGEWEGINLDF